MSGRGFSCVCNWLSGCALALCAMGAVAEPFMSSERVPEAVGWRLETVATGLEHPWSIAWLPDGSALITERPGRLRRLRAGKLDPQPLAGTPSVLAEGQGGLLDVVAHPRFAANHWIYLTYAAGTRSANRTTLARARLDGQRLREFEILWQNPVAKKDTQHFGSRLLWLDDDRLLMSVGDGGNPPISYRGHDIREQAQRLETPLGKILCFTADGKPHPDNPFSDQRGARPEIFTFGHRNIQGLTLDPASGRVWANEHGARGGDELNRIMAGNNYGWPAVTYSHEYWGPKISDVTTREDVMPPLVVWTPSKAPSGLTFYTGSEFPQWQGDLLSGALKFGEVRRLDLEGDRVIAEEKLTIGRRVRDVRQGADGGLYVLTDVPDGALLRIVPAVAED